MSGFVDENSSKGKQDFLEIPLSIIKLNERYDFNIYIRVRESYRLFIAKCAVFSEQHARVMGIGNTKLYASREDWGKVQEYETLHLSSILIDPDVSVEDKADIAFSTSMESISRIMETRESRTVRHREPMAEDMAKLILTEEKVMDNLIWVSSHDHFTYQHSVRVGIYATALTMKLFGARLTRAELCSLSEGYFLHDLGMASVPHAIIDKRGPLDPEEWRIIRMHPVWGSEKLKEAGHLTPEALRVVLSHHERVGGKGYPHGIAGGEIPVYAKICALADVFEALTAVRPYRRPKDTYHALKIIQQEMAGEFDREMLKAFILMLGPRR
jgi:HD-GYP domain-containing protein (c-di-GMP phosphodiesterase class II)